MNTIVNFFTSLRLTVACLAAALGLVFIGTLAQVKLGLYIVQDQFFNSFFIWWSPNGGDLKVPIWPGGYLVGGLLLVNLIAAHIKRFELSRKKLGIFTIHAGLILLLIGQLVTQLFQVESFMAIEEGASKNYSESGRFAELAVIDTTDPKTNLVVAIPQGLMEDGREVTSPNLPFKVKVANFFENASPKVNGKALNFEQQPIETAMDKRNLPAAIVSVETDEGVKGPFEVSYWQNEKELVGIIADTLKADFTPAMVRPPGFTYKGHTYELRLRPIRFYKPFTMELIDFTHDVYAGTDKPKAFSSRIKLIHPETAENRELLIYMNNPLRYNGETYYQGSFLPHDSGTVLQVVRNPGWITPYVACSLVGAGLLIQFLSHLIGFARKRRTA